MVNPKEWLEFGQKFHGHKCPAMPMGLRVGAAALNNLGLNALKTVQFITRYSSNLGDNHCATCYADGFR